MTQLREEGTAARTRRRDKLGPDPAIRRRILTAASATLRTEGVSGLSIAAVLDRAGLSTRAFYRHFDSKDALVAEVFLDAARIETRRLRRRMASAATEIDAVAAWVDARLDLAFDPHVRSDLRRLSQEAQSQTFVSPNSIQPAFLEMLKPLADALQGGVQSGAFHDVDPVIGARFIHGVVWTGIDRQWADGDCDRAEVRAHILRFCLGGLGVAAELIDGICSG